TSKRLMDEFFANSLHFSDHHRQNTFFDIWEVRIFPWKRLFFTSQSFGQHVFVSFHRAMPKQCMRIQCMHRVSLAYGESGFPQSVKMNLGFVHWDANVAGNIGNSEPTGVVLALQQRENLKL